MDLKTDFGKYHLVSVITRKFQSALEIERLKSLRTGDSETSAAELNLLYEKHITELEVLGG